VDQASGGKAARRAYLKLVDSSRVRRENRAHFLAVAAQLMRRILVGFARSRRYQKRGGEWQQVTLDEGLAAGAGPESDLVALDEALQALARLDARKAQVWNCGSLEGSAWKRRLRH
jgi:hypothetical protein